MNAITTQKLFSKGHTLAEELLFSQEYPWQVLPFIHGVMFLKH